MIGVLLVNLGTPDSPRPWDVYRYLQEFLLDGRVIDVPWLQRQLLVRGIIVPFRHRSSAATYKEVWTENGSPLLVYSRELAEKVQDGLGEGYLVRLAMRYQKPSIEQALSQLDRAEVEKLIVFPLFPQYASATTGSVHERVMKVVSSWHRVPDLHFVKDYPVDPLMIRAFAERGRDKEVKDFDHILMSFHGLPERHIRKSDRSGKCLTGHCCQAAEGTNAWCYRRQCYCTARALAQELEIDSSHYTVCFQSRLGKDPWIQPYTTDVLELLAKKGIKRLAVFCPAFVADCLETIFEVGVEYAEDWKKLGGEELILVDSVNAHPLWVDAVCQMIQARVPQTSECHA